MNTWKINQLLKILKKHCKPNKQRTENQDSKILLKNLISIYQVNFLFLIFNNYSIPFEMLLSKLLKRESQMSESLSHNIKQPLQWQQVKTPSDIIARRCCHSSCIIEDNLYIYGGYDSNSPGIFNDFHTYSFKDSVWKKIKPSGLVPGQRHSHTMITYQGKIYLFGGIISLMNNTNELHEFNISLNIWRKVQTKNTPPAIDSHKACIYQNRMIIGLGYSENDYNSKIYELNLINFQWKCLFNPKKYKAGQYPSPRAHGSFNILNNQIFIYGGKDFTDVFNDLWKFDLEKCKYSQIHLKNPLPGRFGHSGTIYDEKIFIFGGTQGVTHERNDLISINILKQNLYTCWADSQEQRGRVKEELSPLLKKSRRDSTKKAGNQYIDEDQKQKTGISNPSGKYRHQLKDVNYYNYLYDSRKRQGDLLKKTKRNPLLTELQGTQQEGQSLNLTSTFQILTNSILLTMGKSFAKADNTQLPLETLKKVPKARDNYTVDLYGGQNSKLIIFGGGMHKVCYNDLIFIQLKALISKHLPV